ncbi:hypothetical protein MARLIPOL_12040 [Marinobacter lipolyticus SM19]|uniref:Uncharacterized protein n=1 Tax=Marinobacter lipolyticus SM19 TaxID=1318628 RepID=R8AZ98_9GAMM|nr:hypothetical protein MARLIPOL_12040 [Marinobacter lipolyticus SM19]
MNGDGFGKTAVTAIWQGNYGHDYLLLWDSAVIRTKDHMLVAIRDTNRGPHSQRSLTEKNPAG